MTSMTTGMATEPGLLKKLLQWFAAFAEAMDVDVHSLQSERIRRLETEVSELRRQVRNSTAG